MNPATRSFSPRAYAGYWLAALLAISQLYNAARVALDPVAYATYMGVPLAAVADAGWVWIYASRALFMGLLAGWLLWRSEFGVLRVMALLALVMPAADFYRVLQAQGSSLTLARHALIGAVLVAAWWALGRLQQRVVAN